MATKINPFQNGKIDFAGSPESDPLSLHLDQSSPQSMTGLSDGFLGLTGGVFGNISAPAQYWTEAGGLLYPTTIGDFVLIGSSSDDSSGAILQVAGGTHTLSPLQVGDLNNGYGLIYAAAAIGSASFIDMRSGADGVGQDQVYIALRGNLGGDYGFAMDVWGSGDASGSPFAVQNIEYAVLFGGFGEARDQTGYGHDTIMMTHNNDTLNYECMRLQSNFGTTGDQSNVGQVRVHNALAIGPAYVDANWTTPLPATLSVDGEMYMSFDTTGILKTDAANGERLVLGGAAPRMCFEGSSTGGDGGAFRFATDGGTVINWEFGQGSNQHFGAYSYGLSALVLDCALDGTISLGNPAAGSAHIAPTRTDPFGSYVGPYFTFWTCDAEGVPIFMVGNTSSSQPSDTFFYFVSPHDGIIAMLDADETNQKVYFGSCTAHAFAVRTSNTDRFTLDAAGAWINFFGNADDGSGYAFQTASGIHATGDICAGDPSAAHLVINSSGNMTGHTGGSGGSVPYVYWNLVNPTGQTAILFDSREGVSGVGCQMGTNPNDFYYYMAGAGDQSGGGGLGGYCINYAYPGRLILCNNTDSIPTDDSSGYIMQVRSSAKFDTNVYIGTQLLVGQADDSSGNIAQFGGEVGIANGIYLYGSQSTNIFTAGAMVDYYSGKMRILSFGPDGSTNGGFSIYSARSDNSNNNFPLQVTADQKFGIYKAGGAETDVPTYHFELFDASHGSYAYFDEVNKQLSVGSIKLGYVAKTTTYPITASDYTIDCTANSFTTTLPTAVGCTGQIYNIKNSGTGTITVATTSSQTIDGNTTQVLAGYDNLQVQSNGANWIIL